MQLLQHIVSGQRAVQVLLSTIWGQWVVQILQQTASLWAVGLLQSATPAIHCLTAWGQWAVKPLQYPALLPGEWPVQLLQCTASLPRGSGQWNSWNTLPHYRGAVGNGTPAIQCLTAWGQWAVQLL